MNRAAAGAPAKPGNDALFAAVENVPSHALRLNTCFPETAPLQVVFTGGRRFARRPSLLLSGLSLPQWIEINYRRMGPRNRQTSEKKNTFLWVLHYRGTSVYSCDPQPHCCSSSTTFVRTTFLLLSVSLSLSLTTLAGR